MGLVGTGFHINYWTEGQKQLHLIKKYVFAVGRILQGTMHLFIVGMRMSLAVALRHCDTTAIGYKK